MTGRNTFAKRFLELLDRIPLVKRSERWRNGQRTRSEFIDGMQCEQFACANALPAWALGAALHGSAVASTPTTMTTPGVIVRSMKLAIRALRFREAGMIGYGTNRSAALRYFLA